MSYNIHLPLDISVTIDDPILRRQAVQTMQRIIDMTAVLSPSTYTLHLPFEETDQTQATINQWQERGIQSLTEILSADVNPRDISVETLDYPFEWAEPVVEALDVAVCLDLGHLMVYGYDTRKAFEKHAARTSIIHLHGVENGKDHLALDRLSDENARMVMDILRRFEGVVSLEVFSYEKLAASLEFLAIHRDYYL
jgi:sugar phosphate isomerase/epimerase